MAPTGYYTPPSGMVSSDHLAHELQHAAKRYRTQIEKVTGERDRAIRTAAEHGLSIRAIARNVDLHPSRVHQIIHAAK